MSKFAKKFEMDEDEMIELLTNNGYLKKNGNPTKKGEDYLDDDAVIKEILENLELDQIEEL